MPQPDVNQLLPGLAAGKPEAFAALVDQLGDRLYRAARQLVDTPADADDAVQETFAAIVRARQSLSAVRDLDAYLFTTLRRAAARCRDRQGPSTLPLEQIGEIAETEQNPTFGTPGSATSKASDSDVQEQLDRLQRAVQMLPDAQREVLTLKFDGELTLIQIAAVLNISPNTAASRYRYALEKLRNLMSVRASQ